MQLFFSLVLAVISFLHVCSAAAFPNAEPFRPAKHPTTSSTTTSTATATTPSCVISEIRTKTETETPTVTSTIIVVVTTATVSATPQTTIQTTTVTSGTTVVTSTFNTDSTTWTTTTSTVDGGPSTTTIVPTPDGFLPIQSTLPDSSYDGAGGGIPPQKRDLRALKNAGLDKRGARCSTTTIYKWTTTTIDYVAPVTVTQTVSSTSTSNVTPVQTVAVTSGVPETDTTTVTSFTNTVTSTTTTTTTTYDAATILYAACALDNFADMVSGAYIDRVDGQPVADGGAYQLYYDIYTAYDCCTLAFLPENANELYCMFQWFPQYNTCALNQVAASAEPNNQNDQPITVDQTGSSGSLRVVGNLYEGMVNQVGPVG